RLLDLLEPVFAEERAERGLEQRGEHVPIADEAVELFTRERLLPALAKAPPEVELARDDRAALPRDDGRADLGQAALGEVRVILVERARHGQLEDTVAEELEALVGERPVGRPGRVGEDPVRAPLRKLVDQSGERPGWAPRAAATGARRRNRPPGRPS